jgi:hypothetical protein
MNTETLNQVLLVLKEFIPLLITFFGSIIFLFSINYYIEHDKKNK